jgi:hypothetical protein
MTNLVNLDSLTFTGEIVETRAGVAKLATVEVTLRGKTQRCPARTYEDSANVYVSGLSGRYEQGAKVWPASITCFPAENGRPARQTAWFGRDDRSGRFHKENGLFFA